MAVKHAMDLLMKHCIVPETKRLALPVDPEQIAIKEGLKVLPLADEEMALSGKYAPEEKTIYFNPYDSDVRKRFTIAHELGHYALGHGGGFRDPMKNFNAFHFDPLEVQANQFAAELLMPVAAIKYFVDKKGISSIEELKKIFGVSGNAIGFRLKNLGMI